MPNDDAVDAKQLRARNERLSELFGTPAEPRIRAAMQLRAELRRRHDISERAHVGIIAADLQLHRNTVYRLLRLGDADPEKYK